MWNRFSTTRQERVSNITAWFEPSMTAYSDKTSEMERRELDKAGVKGIHFSIFDGRLNFDRACDVAVRCSKRVSRTLFHHSEN
jgi:hypothetical protein